MEAKATLNDYFVMERYGTALLNNIRRNSKVKTTDMVTVVNHVKQYFDVKRVGQNYLVVKNNGKNKLEEDVIDVLSALFDEETISCVRTKYDKNKDLVVRL